MLVFIANLFLVAKIIETFYIDSFEKCYKEGTAAFSLIQFDYPQFLRCYEAGGVPSANKMETQAMGRPLMWGLSLT